MRCVLDINVLVASFGPTTGPPTLVVEAAMLGAYELVLSDAMISVVARVFQKPYFVHHVTPVVGKTFLDALSTSAELVRPDPTVRGVAPDAEDDLVLATAVAGEVDYLVTGDTRFLSLTTYRGVRLISPRAFLELLDTLT